MAGKLPRRLRDLGILFLLLTAGLVGLASPAGAAEAVGYVRLAHLSPDTPEVDVYLSKFEDTTSPAQKFPGVGYGVISNYLALPVGTYVVAMRLAGDPESKDPVLTTKVTVEEGGAYTVAGVGEHAQLGLTVLTDDLSRPAPGKAKVRVIQASVASKVLDVSLANGTPIATAVQFATTTDYQLVSPGTWSLKLQRTGSSTVTTVTAKLGVGNVYSLLVLDGPDGLTTQLRTDVRGGNPPDGGVETGVGGTADKLAPTTATDPILLMAAGLAVLVVLLAVAMGTRRLASRRS